MTTRQNLSNNNSLYPILSSQSAPLDSFVLAKTLSVQEQSMISGGEIRTCENGLKPFMGDFSTCPENKKKTST